MPEKLARELQFWLVVSLRSKSMVSFSVIDTAAAEPIGTFADEEVALTIADAIGQSHGLEHIAVQCDDGHGHAMVIAEGWEVAERAHEAQLS